ncbi:MAG: nucleotidyltransferase family protein [Alphaproteobacteria bacterium]
MSEGLSKIDIVVLAGGLGTRLAGVLDGTPKILAPVRGQPYIVFLLSWLRRFGARRVVFCLGHLAGLVEAWLAEHPQAGLRIATVREPEPAGTAGALRYAAPVLQGDPVMVMNGDSFIDGDLTAFLNDFQAEEAAASVMCVEMPDCSRYGRVVLNDSGWIARFAEKDPAESGAGFINAGVYLFSRAFLADPAMQAASSLERDIFAAAAPGTIRGYATAGTFHDIGTPESLAAAAAILSPYLDAARGRVTP